MFSHKEVQKLPSLIDVKVLRGHKVKVKHGKKNCRSCLHLKKEKFVKMVEKKVRWSS